MTKIFFSIIFVTLFSCSKQDVPGDFVIVANKIFDGKSFSYSKKYITVKGEKIVDIRDVPPKSKIKIVDIGKKFLLPGLIDGHTHLFYEDDEEVRSKDERMKRAKIFKKEYLKSGFVGLVDLGNSGHFLDVDLREEEAHVGPSLFVSGPGIATSNAQMSSDIKIKDVKKEYTIINFSQSLEQQLQSHIKNKVNFLKVFVDNDPAVGSLNEEELKRIQKFAKKHDLEIHAHTVFADSIEKGLKLNLNYLHHSYQINQKGLELMKSSCSDFIPTFFNKSLFKHSDEKRQKDGRYELLTSLFKQKKRIGFGSDIYIKNLDRGVAAIESLLSYSDYGLSNAEFLISATSFWTDKLKPHGTYGIIQVGAYANFLILDGEIDKYPKALRANKTIFFKGRKLK